MKVTITIPPDLLPMLEEQRPRTLTTTGFCALLVEQGLTNLHGVPRLPAYRVGAGHQGTEQKQPTPQQPSPQTGSGDSAPTEAVRVARKKADTVVPQSLSAHSSLIQEFWRTKKGAKSETAWKLLMTELQKIQDYYDDGRVEEQLQLAINARWQGITLRNMQSFEKTQPKSRDSEIDFDALDKIRTGW